MPSDERRRISDLDTLKAIGHPLRLKLYRALHIKRTATASQLADQVDEAVSSSATTCASSPTTD